MKSYKVLTMAFLLVLVAPMSASASIDSIKEEFSRRGLSGSGLEEEAINKYSQELRREDARKRQAALSNPFQNLVERVKGKILLQVQDKGQAYYVDPTTEQRAYLGRPSDAFRIMSELGLGISNVDLEKIANPWEAHKDLALARRLAGRIVLQVEEHGEAYYISPTDFKKYYLGRPDDAFNVMRDQGLGITNDDLEQVPVFQKYQERVESLEQDVKVLGEQVVRQEKEIQDLREQLQQNNSPATTTPPSLHDPSVATSTPSALPATPAIPATPAVPATPSPGNGATPATPAIPATPATPATPDTTAPVISNVQATSITETSATITWTTDEASNSTVSYATTPTATSTIDVLQSSIVTSHSVALSGLASGTTHYFTVSSTDASNNTAKSGEQSFATLAVESQSTADAAAILAATQFNVYALTQPYQNTVDVYFECPVAANVSPGIVYGEESETTINGQGYLEGIMGVQTQGNCTATNGTKMHRMNWFTPAVTYNYQVVFFTPETSYFPPLSADHFPEIDYTARKVYTDEDKLNEVYRVVPHGSFTAE